MKIDAAHPLLLNMQYVEGNRRQKIPDYLYVLWKDLDTGEKHLEQIPEPKVDIYFEKPEYRDHEHVRKWQYMDRTDRYTCKYSDIKFAILKDWGEEGDAFWKNIVATKNWGEMRKIDLYPYVFANDIDITSYYRHHWMNKFGTPEKIDLHTAFLDIEADSFAHEGFANAETDPIDLVTVIDRKTMKSYTFALVGREYVPRDTTGLNEEAKKHIEAYDRNKKRWYDYRLKQEKEFMENIDAFIDECHRDFDETFGVFDYQYYFYTDEAKMLTHLFQLIHETSPDFLFVWNISFDVPYMIKRMKTLGLDPKEIMPDPDLPVKVCRFKKDNFNFEIKNKSDYFYLTGRTIWYDDMILYAAKRKGQDELPSKRLTDIAKKELGEEKLPYDEIGSIKKFGYMNYWKYNKYNIKDVLLQVGIDDVTEDSRTLYVTSYDSLVGYDSVWKQISCLRSMQNHYYLNHGFVPGANENGILASFIPYEEKAKKKKDDDKFEGALVGPTELINDFGMELYGKKTKYLFKWSVDMDMSAFYPNTNGLLNISAESLIFKVIVPGDQFSILGGTIPFKGITDVQVLPKNRNPWRGEDAKDVSKEIFDNFQTRSYLSVGYKFMNLPSFEEIEEELREVME